MIKEFSPEVCEKLGYYVYRLIDPRNGQTFYVGKGKGNRVFAHVECALKNYEGENYSTSDEDEVSEKFKQIREIKSAGLDVIHIIHRHGLSEQEAFEVEAALIDCFPGLTNLQSGHNNDFGANNAEVLQQAYSLETYEEPETLSYMIIKTTNDRITNDCNGSLYDAVRYSWKVSKSRVDKIKYVLGVVSGVVKEVYEVEKWQLADNGVRYEFIGHVALDEIRNIFINKRIPEKYLKKGSANPIQYYD